MDRRNLFLAVDGFSKMCRAQLVDDCGLILGEARSSSVSLRIGASAALIAVENVAKKVLTVAGLSFETLPRLKVGLGLPGANIQHLRNDFLNKRLPFRHFNLMSDFQIACLGAHGGDEGAILIIDTLSAGLIYREGVFFSVGGWDFPLSCFGGGAHIGLSLLQSALLAHEGMGPGSDLTRQIMDSFDNDAEQLSNWSKRAIPNEFSRYAPVVFEAAEAGDEVACTLLRNTMDTVETLCSTLVTMGADRLCLAGDLMPFVSSYLSTSARQRLVEPLGDSMLGALLLAGFPPEKIPDYLDNKAKYAETGMSIEDQTRACAQQLSENNTAFPELNSLSADQTMGSQENATDRTAHNEAIEQYKTNAQPSDEDNSSANEHNNNIMDSQSLALDETQTFNEFDHDRTLKIGDPSGNGVVNITPLPQAHAPRQDDIATNLGAAPPWYTKMMARG